jgi:ABC-type ATPase involved in cell division
VPPIPTTVISGANMTYNNININNSTIGSLNTRTIHELDVHIGNVSKNDQNLAESLKVFTEAVAAAQDVEDSKKNDILEQLKFVLDDIQSKKTNPSIIKTVLNGIESSVKTSASLITIWEKLHPALSMVFGC